MLSRVNSFYGKILLTIMLCFVFPLAVVFFYGYDRLEHVMMEKMEQLMESNLDHMDEAIQNLSDRVNQTSAYLSSDLRLNELLREYTEKIPDGVQPYDYNIGQPDFMEKYEYLNFSVELQNIMVNYADNWLSDSIEMGIIGNDGRLFSTWPEGNTDFEQLDEILWNVKEGGSAYFTDIHPRFIHYGENTDYFTYVKVLYDIKDVKSQVGILVAAIPISTIEDIVMQYYNSDIYALYVMNSENEIMHAFFRENQGSDEDRLIENMAVNAKNEETIIRDEEGKRYLLNTFSVEGVEWNLSCVVPYEKVFEEALNLRKDVIGICASLIILLAVISLLVIYRLFSPLRVLRDTMRRVESGNWEIEPIPSVSNDEIGMLTSGFNRLTAKLNNMLQQEKESERQKGELRFEMLLAQINPHFLFNTLNSIKWMAAMIHAENITNTICALARLLEISMNKQADMLPISEELRNLDSYLYIQGVRYSELFSVEYRLDESIGRYQTLKLVFQPIVENAIIHNIQEVNPLNIEIEGKIEGACVVFRVRDNGRGMNPEQVERLMQEDIYAGRSIFRGIGVRNVHQRIQLKYGEQYGIAIFSEVGKGTLVEIRFPAIMFEEVVEDMPC